MSELEAAATALNDLANGTELEMALEKVLPLLEEHHRGEGASWSRSLRLPMALTS